MSEPVLRVADLHVSFGDAAVLRGVDLRVSAGECVAVVGPSGAGKSVLARSLVGLASEGGAPARTRAQELVLDGADLTRASERTWRGVRGRRVGLVLQDALGSLDPLRTVAAEVGEALGREVRGDARRAAVLDALARAGLDEPEVVARQLPGQLSGGMRQRALIASAMVANPPLLVLDEPTTALDATVAAGVLEQLGRLRDAGAAMVLVTHDFGAVARLADRVAVLGDGRIVEEGPTAQLLSAPQHALTRGLLSALPRGAKARPGPEASSAVVLEGKNLTKTYPIPGGERHAVVDVGVRVHAGETLGVVGESGSGKSTLARLLIAAENPSAGEVELDGAVFSPLPERERRSRRGRIRLVNQDALGSMDPRRSVGQILRDAGAADAGAIRELLAVVQLEPGLAGRMPRSLSGGQRQRVAIARALAGTPEILLLDEPVSALDTQVQAGILELLAQLPQARSVAMVLISHDLAVVRALSDRVAVMNQGRIVEEGATEALWAATQHPVTRALLDAAAPTRSSS